MSSFIDGVSFCDSHGYYYGNAATCKGCLISGTYYITLDELVNKPQSRSDRATSVLSIPLGADTAKKPETANLATNPDFSNDIPVKIGKSPKRGGSQKWRYKGHKLDSTNEKDRFLYLEALEERGVISELMTQFTYIIMYPVDVPANYFFFQFEQPQEIYTVDFLYRYRGYVIFEDAKGPRLTPKKKLLKPRVKADSATKAKALQEILATKDKTVFMYSVFHKGTWHYFNTKLDESDFSLE